MGVDTVESDDGGGKNDDYFNSCDFIDNHDSSNDNYLKVIRVMMTV